MSEQLEMDLGVVGDGPLFDHGWWHTKGDPNYVEPILEETEDVSANDNTGPRFNDAWWHTKGDPNYVEPQLVLETEPINVMQKFLGKAPFAVPPAFAHEAANDNTPEEQRQAA